MERIIEMVKGIFGSKEDADFSIPKGESASTQKQPDESFDVSNLWDAISGIGQQHGQEDRD